MSEKRIIWIESIGTTQYTRRYREGIEANIAGMNVDLIFDYDSVSHELKNGNNGLWIIDGNYPSQLSGLVDRIKKEHPLAKIVVYHANDKNYAIKDIDAQVNISNTSPDQLAELVSKYLN